MSDNTNFRVGKFPVELWDLLVNDKPIYSCFLEIQEQIGQDSALDGNTILKNPELAYAIIRINARINA
jgi:hypothetical protein